MNKILISKINKKTKKFLIKKKSYLIYKFHYIKYNELSFWQPFTNVIEYINLIINFYHIYLKEEGLYKLFKIFKK